jgi:hypothetical protein
VSEESNTASESIDDDAQGGYPAALIRLVPAVTFGLRAAALAGFVVSAGAVAVGLAGVFDDANAVAYTTCSGGPHPPC